MVLVFVSYVSFIWIKYGAQKSISESYYRLPSKYNFIFTLFIWGFALPAMVIGNSLLMFFAGAGIAFVGSAAAFEEKLTKTVHYAGAGIGILASQLAIIINYDMWWVSVSGLVISILFAMLFKKYAIWIVELVAFISIAIVLGVSIF